VQHIRLGQIAGEQGALAMRQRVDHGLADAHAAAAVAARAARQLLQPVDRALERRDQQRALVDRGALKGIVDAERLEVPLLGHHRQRVEQHKAREMRRRAGQRPAAELGEDMLARRGLGRHHAMAGLCAAVVAHDCVGIVGAGQEVDDRALAGVAKAEIDSEEGVLHG
jgi:hypothetical protein